MQINATVTFTISPAVPPPLKVTNTDFSGQVNVPLTGTLGITGGVPPYVVSVPDTSVLPPGVSIDANGNISGTPTKDGTFPVGVSVTDSAV